MAAVHYAPKAIEDLDDINSYITRELGNPAAAQRTIAAILNRIALLATFPRSGTPLAAAYPLFASYRYVVVGNYLAFYRVQGDDVYVDRVLYGRTDYITTLLEDDLKR